MTNRRKEGCNMRARRILVTAIVACAAVAASAAYAHNASFVTKVTLASGGPTGAQGKVTLPNGGPKGCKANRKVSLFLKTGSGDVLIGSDMTDSKGRWRVNAPLTSGNYHAKAAAKVLKNEDHTHRCKKARSLTKHL